MRSARILARWLGWPAVLSSRLSATSFGQRRRDEVALDHVDFLLDQGFKLGPGLDALGDGVLAEVFRQRDDRANDLGALLVLQHPRNERSSRF